MMKKVVVKDLSESMKNVKKVRNLVHSDRCLSIRATAVQLNLDKETVKKPKLWLKNWNLHHGNAPAHKTLSVKEFLAQKSITEMKHPPYSPDLASNDFLLFTEIKSALKGLRSQDTEDIQ